MLQHLSQLLAYTVRTVYVRGVACCSAVRALESRKQQQRQQ